MAEINDVPLQRHLKIGKATIGLVGLDIALNRVIGDTTMADEEAAQQVYEEICRLNYVPDIATATYREAILKEVIRLREGESDGSGELVIRILGPGCVSCNNLQKIVFEVMAGMEVAADIFQIHDLDEIGRYGVM